MKDLQKDRSIFLKNYLIENYSSKTKEEITKELNLSWRYIQKLCHLFKIKRSFNFSKRNLVKLLDIDDNITCYWLGFLLADGHISKDNVINVNLSTKDESHFDKIQSHLDIKLSKSHRIKTNSIRYTLCDKQTILKLKEMFNWQSNKTKNIPTIPKLGNDQLFSLIIGFIDGDGTINKDGSMLALICDFNWKKILESFYTVLTDEIKIFNTTSANTSTIWICKIKILERIKNRAKLLNLPIMERKWNRIIDNRILKSDKYSIVRNILESNRNKSIELIMKETDFSYSLIYKVKKNLERESNFRF